MFKKFMFVCVVVFVLLAAFQTSFSADNINIDTPFESTNLWNKLDDGVKAAWSDAKKSGDMTTNIECFIRINESPDPGDRSFLESHGFVVRVFEGRIVRGHMKVSAVPDVAKLPFVAKISKAK